MTTFKRKLIEVALPLDAINRESAREKSIRHGHPSTLHLWWSRKPLSAARAVLWSSLVDDPSSHPDRFPTEELQEAERQRLFGILEELVKWENSNNEQVLEAARAEIVASCDGDLPRVLDPFCGGGTIPLEAQRLGLEALGGDLNPVAVLISKAMVEIPPRFAGMPPVNPVSRAESGLKTWERAQGLAEDVRYYGQWMRDRAFERIGHLYPKVTLPEEQGGGEATVIAWIWARTVESPDPSWNGHVPLVNSWVLRKARKGKPVVWIEPTIDRERQTVSYRIREGGKPAEATVVQGKGRCLATGTPIDLADVDKAAARDELGLVALAVAVEGDRHRHYMLSPDVDVMLSPDVDVDDEIGRLLAEAATEGRIPDEPARGTFAGNAQGRRYGFDTFADYYLPRQLVALAEFSRLVVEVRDKVLRDADQSGRLSDSTEPLRRGGSGREAYADAVLTYLAFGVDKSADYWSTLVNWNYIGEALWHVFTRQAIAVAWGFAEANPFSSSAGNWLAMIEWIAKALERLPASGIAEAQQLDAASLMELSGQGMLSFDPPYYNNISYADVSDYFYVWLRRSLRDIWPDELSTVLTPKAEELIANRYRAGSDGEAEEHFRAGMARALEAAARAQSDTFPTTIYYAFKQEESDGGGVSSTGWETFLGGVLDAGSAVVATWPLRTERSARSVAIGTAALASSIVIACRPREIDAPLASSNEFRSALRAELPEAIRVMQKGAIAPVDLAQSAIGPGMAVFSRYSKVVEADGSKMTVRRGLQIINEVLDEVISEEETEFDADTRWAVTWYRQFGLNPGQYGTAETLSKAKNTSVAGVIEAGFAASRDGKVWLLGREGLDPAWDPVEDRRSTVWEATQHLVARLDHSEPEAAGLLRRLGGTADRARQLAYLLYRVAEQKGWAQEAVAYNSLVVAWPELERLARAESAPGQLDLEA